ncbi:hypothetical protein U1Q18_005412, partial [Sarracenia purpurea var. burkii]
MEPKVLEKEEPVVVAREVDEDWLKSCVVGIVKEQIEVDSIQQAMESDEVLSCHGDATSSCYCCTIPFTM